MMVMPQSGRYQREVAGWEGSEAGGNGIFASAISVCQDLTWGQTGGKKSWESGSTREASRRTLPITATLL